MLTVCGYKYAAPAAEEATRNLRPAGQILGSEPSGTNLVVVSGWVGFLPKLPGKKIEI